MTWLSLAGAVPASAGGIGAIANPAFDNTCIILSKGAQAVGRVARGSGIVNDLVQVPLDAPNNHCGGTDLPMLPTLSGREENLGHRALQLARRAGRL
ncbi:hypothetical protein ACFP1Z_30800 [Streptomyces gamaensis]|uniref:Uncharacterized protein n=1 Tax=Streptomyces gamaensis TaxID=1763542 RepID=A0ABW0Z9L8_9ACTN